MSKVLSRRDFLKVAAVTAAGSVLASCAPAAQPTTQAQPTGAGTQPTVASNPRPKEDRAARGFRPGRDRDRNSHRNWQDVRRSPR